jgi:hypothetical protein
MDYSRVIIRLPFLPCLAPESTKESKFGATPAGSKKGNPRPGGPVGPVGLQVPSHFETISIVASSTLLIHGYSTEIYFVSGFNPSGPIRFVFVTWG